MPSSLANNERCEANDIDEIGASQFPCGNNCVDPLSEIDQLKGFSTATP